MTNRIRDLELVIASANAHVPDGYKVARDSLPERVELMAQGLCAFVEDRQSLREENQKLRAVLETFYGQMNNLGQLGAAEHVLQNLDT